METLLLRCRYDRHMLQASETEDRLPFPCSTHVRHLHHVSNKSRRLNQYRDEHRDSPRNHTTSPADVLPIPANGRRSLAMASIPVTAACGADRYTAHWSSHMRKRHASCKPSKVYPTHWQGFTAIANATHACESSRDGRSMIWHAAVFSYTKTDRNCASLGIMVEAGA
jgi:hypothetical protein